MRISDWSSDVCSSDLINVLGCTIRYFTYAGIKIQNSSNINVIGNIVTEGAKPTAANTNASYGIITASGIRSSVVQQYHSNIANNVIKGCRRQGILNSVDYAKITNNTIDGVQNATLGDAILNRSEEHTSELQSLMRISYAVFCLKKKNNQILY